MCSVFGGRLCCGVGKEEWSFGEGIGFGVGRRDFPGVVGLGLKSGC